MRAIAVLLITIGLFGAIHFTSQPLPKHEPSQIQTPQKEKPKPKKIKPKVQKKVAQPTKPTTQPPQSTPQKSATGKGIVRLINQVRVKHGLPSLIEASNLNLSATLSARGQAKTGTCCDHGNWQQWFTQARANYTYRGENIAACQKSDQEVVNAWVSSPPHLENILSANFKYTGVGKIVSNFKGSFSNGKIIKCIYYTNHFGG